MYTLFRIEDRLPRQIERAQVKPTDLLCFAADVMQARALFVRAVNAEQAREVLGETGAFDGLLAYDGRNLDPMRYQRRIRPGSKLRLVRSLGIAIPKGQVGLVVETIIVGANSRRAFGCRIMFRNGYVEAFGPDELDVMFEVTHQECDSLTAQPDLSDQALQSLRSEGALSFDMVLQ